MTEDLIEHYGKFNHFGKMLGLELVVLQPGVIEYYLTIDKHHLATPNAAHGGVVSAMMDSLLGVTALSAVFVDHKVVSTVEFKLNFLGPALLGDRLKGTARILKKGQRILVVDGEIRCTNRNNEILAAGMGTFNAYPATKAGY